MRFLEGLDPDLKLALLAQLRDLWTHTSTALEGNTLTLGDTAFVLAEGLTVSGKPLKDHQEVVGHAKAITLLYTLLQQDRPIVDTDLFELHKAVQTAVILDIEQPVGRWKCYPNGTHAITPEGQQAFIDYAAPEEVPTLMTQWLAELNQAMTTAGDETRVLQSYADLHLAFVRIHPFADGNGRMARLLANLPVLKAGFPPILIDRTRRRDYLRCLSVYDLAVGTATLDAPLLPDSSYRHDFQQFCRECWQVSLELVSNIRIKQAHRR
jgi:Fic family protein